MPDKLKKALLGAVIALALGFAVSYGLIDKQTADKIQTSADEMISDQPAPQPAPAPQQQPPAPAPHGGAPAPQPPAPAPERSPQASAPPPASNP
ncbi:hypothetical protein [Methylopila sp. M107]|uniref:hypothetical protein n=1 Tax=Methylopila sp. M107 TaxID=1101190 RepID=UPI00037218A2|nr:hypothetical protein [Methylopila sp. M107]